MRHLHGRTDESCHNYPGHLSKHNFGVKHVAAKLFISKKIEMFGQFVAGMDQCTAIV